MMGRKRREIVALRQAVRELYGCVIDGPDGCGPYDRDEHGRRYDAGDYIVDKDAARAAERVVPPKRQMIAS